jgi:hypothetical protein
MRCIDGAGGGSIQRARTGFGWVQVARAGCVGGKQGSVKGSVLAGRSPLPSPPPAPPQPNSGREFPLSRPNTRAKRAQPVGFTARSATPSPSQITPPHIPAVKGLGMP